MNICGVSCGKAGAASGVLSMLIGLAMVCRGLVGTLRANTSGVMMVYYIGIWIAFEAFDVLDMVRGAGGLSSPRGCCAAEASCCAVLLRRRGACVRPPPQTCRRAPARAWPVPVVVRRSLADEEGDARGALNVLDVRAKKTRRTKREDEQEEERVTEILNYPAAGAARARSWSVHIVSSSPQFL